MRNVANNPLHSHAKLAGENCAIRTTSFCIGTIIQGTCKVAMKALHESGIQ